MARRFCVTPESVAVRNAHVILGVPFGSPPKAIKMKYYKLAKETHPDLARQRIKTAEAARGPKPKAQKFSESILGDPDEGPDVETLERKFLEVQEAFELLMDLAEGGGEAGGAAKAKPNRPSQRTLTLGEVLCNQLSDDPGSLQQIWAEVVEGRHEVTTIMGEQLFRACTKHAAKSGGIPVALSMLREGTHTGVLPQAVRCSALVTVLNYLSEQEGMEEITETIINEIVDEDRERTDVLAAIGAVYCAGTRSPF